MKKLKVSLLAKVVIAIAAGVVFGQFLPGGIARIFVTFNSLFGNFLSFSIPLIILGLVTPAIGELGKGAGRLLALTALLAYGSTIFSGFFTYFSSSAIFPHILPVNTELTAMENPEDFSRHATTNGCHDSFTAILHHRTRLVLYRQRSIARSLFRLPENHYETDRGSYHSFIATSYFRHFPKHDGERASHERNHHVPESDNCNICPACLAAAYPVHCCWQREWEKPAQVTEKHASGLCNRIGDTVLSRHHPCNIGTGGQERSTGEHRDLCHSPLCHYPSGRQHDEDHRLCDGNHVYVR